MCSPKKSYKPTEEKSAEINRRRGAMVKAIRDAERLNMKHLNENLVNKLDSLGDDISKLFSVFCFVLTIHKSLIRVVLTDEYISESQLTLFQQLIESYCYHNSVKLPDLVDYRILYYRTVSKHDFAKQHFPL
jgi:hypothetical protein